MIDVNNLAEFFAPMQILLVMIIALIVFGPKRLPELGRQIGSALRELNKAKSEMMKSFSLDHEPEPAPYHEPYNYSAQTDYSTYTYGYEPTPDLTDYTIAGQPVHESSAPALEGTVARSTEIESAAANGVAHNDVSHAADHSAGVDASPVTVAAAEAVEGEQHHV